MKPLVIFITIFAIFLGCAHSQSAHDQTCEIIQKQGVAACFDRSTLGFCMKVANEWRAVEAATCDSRLCCNAKLMGCTMDADCKDEWTTMSSDTSISTTEPATSVECAIGNLKKHESDCKRYYYCSRNNWVESVCSVGYYNENQKSCVFGSCNNS